MIFACGLCQLTANRRHPNRKPLSKRRAQRPGGAYENVFFIGNSKPAHGFWRD
jgi:hypothetical protein